MNHSLSIYNCSTTFTNQQLCGERDIVNGQRVLTKKAHCCQVLASVRQIESSRGLRGRG